MNESKHAPEQCDNPLCPCHKHFITVREAARLIRTSERTIYRWLEEGNLPAQKIRGNGWRIAPRQLFSVLE
jgi:excisionase family DNA binding protein